MTTGQPGLQTHRRTGAVLMSGFALVWALAGSTGLSTGGVLTRLLAVGVTGLVVLAALHHRGPGEYAGPVAPDWRRQYNRVGLVQASAIAGVVVGAVLLGHRELIPGAVCAVVAAHFLPLAKVFGAPRFRLVAGALAAVALGGLVVSWLDASVGRSVVGLGAAVVLWWASVPPLRRRHPARVPLGG